MITPKKTAKPKSAPTAKFACLFKADLEEGSVYFVQATRDPPAVRGFESMREGLDHFEGGFNSAVSRGHGWMAGACIYWMQFQPRIFGFKTLAELRKLVGKTVRPVSLGSIAGYEVAFRCADQGRAAKVYAEATSPRLVPA